MIVVLEYEKEDGSRPFSKWFSSLNVQAALKVRTAVGRLEQGNFSNAKAVGQGVSEYKLDFGPGYRVYFGKDGDKLVILLGGGTKKRQSRDIEIAQDLWKAYKSRKRRGE
jgi:putative addiction module killer protein